eukprot:7719769-Prorocentrum_lima.AAC.1
MAGIDCRTASSNGSNWKHVGEALDRYFGRHTKAHPIKMQDPWNIFDCGNACSSHARSNANQRFLKA